MVYLYFYLFINLTLSLTSFAAELKPSHEISLELGETYLLTQSFHKIWVENKKLISVQIKRNHYYIKTLDAGITHFRLDNNLYEISILPIGSKKTFADWTQLSKKFVGLSVDYCGYSVCLQGELYRLTDYDRIVNYIEKFKSNINLALKIEPELATFLQKDIELRLRVMGLTPLKIQFGKPWKIFYPKSNPNFETSVKSLGLQPEILPQATDIADTIKVAVKVVEITKNFERKLGVRWPDSYQAQFLDPLKLSLTEPFEVAIQAAEKAGEAKVLASPNLICRSGKEAEFFAGGEFPIKILNFRSKEILWKRYGIGLKLKPIIDPLGQMSLHIESEISTLDRSMTVDDLPALHTNRVSSYFDLIDSRTIAISGLIKSEVSESTEGLPFLKNIPVLGRLFTSKNFQENKSELVIFVTPELMK